MKANKTLIWIFAITLFAHIVVLYYVALPDYSGKKRPLKLEYALDEPERKVPEPKKAEPPKREPPPQKMTENTPPPEPALEPEPEPLQPISFPQEVVETARVVERAPMKNRRPAGKYYRGSSGRGAVEAPAHAPAVSQPSIDIDALVRDYGRNVAALIERKKAYPSKARKFGIQGRVDLSFRVAQDGRLMGASVTSSSGNSALDEAALKAVNDAAPFPPIPKEAVMDSIQLTVSLLYKIN
ncbi:MAG TPA: energy transducer TonB [bacterium]|nr:energy transducer TonB [bacterium]